MAAITRATAPACVVPGGARFRGRAFQIGADRLEHDVDIVLDAELGPQGRDVDLMGPKVVDDRRTAVEQGLHIDDLPRPVPLLQNLLTEGKPTRPRFCRAP